MSRWALQVDAVKMALKNVGVKTAVITDSAVARDALVQPGDARPTTLVQSEASVPEEIERERRLTNWPMWVIIALWVVAVPVLAFSGLMLFTGLAMAFNSRWQKKSMPGEQDPVIKAQDPFAKSAKRSLPAGWAVHLNEDGNIFYVHKLSGRSTWEFPESDAAPSPTGEAIFT